MERPFVTHQVIQVWITLKIRAEDALALRSSIWFHESSDDRLLLVTWQPICRLRSVRALIRSLIWAGFFLKSFLGLMIGLVRPRGTAGQAFSGS